MAFWNIPLFRKEDPIDTLFDDIFDWTFPPTRYRLHPYQHPYRRALLKRSESKQQTEGATKEDDAFRVSLDVRHYNPDEITLKVDGNKLLVSGKHQQQSDYGYESSEFQRCYPVPSDVDTKGFTSKIGDGGVLEIEAPRIKTQAVEQAAHGIQQDETKYKAVLDVSKFKPEEISVKVQGNELLINGEQKSESKDEKETFVHHRQFARRILLPKTVKLESLHPKLTKDGKLVIEAEKVPAVEPEMRQLTIQQEADQGTMEE